MRKTIIFALLIIPILFSCSAEKLLISGNVTENTASVSSEGEPFETTNPEPIDTIILFYSSINEFESRMKMNNDGKLDKQSDESRFFGDMRYYLVPKRVLMDAKETDVQMRELYISLYYSEYENLQSEMKTLIASNYTWFRVPDAEYSLQYSLDVMRENKIETVKKDGNTFYYIEIPEDENVGKRYYFMYIWDNHFLSATLPAILPVEDLLPYLEMQIVYP